MLAILRHKSPIHILPLFKDDFNIILPPVPMSSQCSRLPIFLTRATCTSHLILPEFIILEISGKEYKLQSYSICNFQQPSATSTVLGPKHSPQYPNLKCPRCVLPLSITPIQNRNKITVLYILISMLLDSGWEDKRFCIV
jgi:hypothetical protein